MADQADIANDYVEHLNGQALRQRPRYTGHSSEACIDCGGSIPEQRQHSIPGVQTCVGCAEVRERKR